MNFEKLEGWKVRVLVLVFVILTLVASGYAFGQTEATNHRLSKLVACQNRYNEESNASQAARAALNTLQIDLQTDENTALADLVTSVSRATTQQEAADAFVKFDSTNMVLKARQVKINQEKEEHPVPPPPSEVCGQ